VPDQKDEFIPADQVEVSPRGRKKILNGDLLDVLAKVTPDQGVVLKSLGTISKTDRPTVSATIRKHWKEIRTEDVRIDFSPAGYAQVRVRA
jgi:hypothetical protein